MVTHAVEVLRFMILAIPIIFFVTGLVFFIRGVYIAIKTRFREIIGMLYCLAGMVLINGGTQILVVLFT